MHAWNWFQKEYFDLRMNHSAEPVRVNVPVAFLAVNQHHPEMKIPSCDLVDGESVDLA